MASKRKSSTTTASENDGLDNGFDIFDGSNSGIYASTKLLEKRKEMLQMEASLGVKREEFETQMRKLKEREKVVLQQRNELTDNIISLDKYIKVFISSEDPFSQQGVFIDLFCLPILRKMNARDHRIY